MEWDQSVRAKRAIASRDRIGIQRQLFIAEGRVLDFTIAIPWPRLADSWQEDVDRLKKALIDLDQNGVQSS